MTARAVNGNPADAGSHGTPVVVESSLDNLRSADVRFLQEAARHGPLHVRVPSDRLVEQLTGSRPLFPAAERLFLAESLCWVTSAAIVDRPVALEMPGLAAQRTTLVVRAEAADTAARNAAREHGVPCHGILPAALAGFPVADPSPPPP
ncbi:MAG TPA: hypothetical protein VIK13_08980, partial [Candidatus Limnocylindrales bacterium]